MKFSFSRSKRRSPTPKPKKIHVGRLTRNVNKEHLYEIFGLFGAIKYIELPTDRVHVHVTRGFAYVEYENASDAEKALEHMDGGSTFSFLALREKKYLFMFI